MAVCNLCLGQNICYPVWVGSDDDGNADFGNAVDHMDGAMARCEDCNSDCVPLDEVEDAVAIAEIRNGPPLPGKPADDEKPGDKRSPFAVLRERTEILDEALAAAQRLKRGEDLDYDRGVQAVLDLIERLKIGALDSNYITAAGDHLVRIESVRVRQMRRCGPNGRPLRLFVVNFHVVDSTVALLRGRSFSYAGSLSNEPSYLTVGEFLEAAFARELADDVQQDLAIEEAGADEQPLTDVLLRLETRVAGTKTPYTYFKRLLAGN